MTIHAELDRNNIVDIDPGSDDFNADAYLAGLEKLAAVGVTWVQVGLPGDDLAHVLETIERFGSSVIKAVN